MGTSVEVRMNGVCVCVCARTHVCMHVCMSITEGEMEWVW